MVIRHEIDGSSTHYCDLHVMAVVEGQPVSRGDVIGAIGVTGWLGRDGLLDGEPGLYLAGRLLRRPRTPEPARLLLGM